MLVSIDHCRFVHPSSLANFESDSQRRLYDFDTVYLREWVEDMSDETTIRECPSHYSTVSETHKNAHSYDVYSEG